MNLCPIVFVRHRQEYCIWFHATACEVLAFCGTFGMVWLVWLALPVPRTHKFACPPVNATAPPAPRFNGFFGAYPLIEFFGCQRFYAETCDRFVNRRPLAPFDEMLAR